jgi:glycosyltransferase involved in cell wall biosynthesis
LNTHVDYLSNALDQEHRSLGIREPHFLHPLMQSRMRREAAVADFIRVPSTLAKQTFVEAGVSADKIAIVPIAVDLNHFHQSVKPDDAFRILAVSSFDPRKGVVYLLEACERLRIPNAELMLIGSTGSRWARKTLSQFEKKLGSVRLVNMDVTTEPAANSYGMASVFVHPAIEDGFGLVIPQALACGIPVIATRTSGASELIVHGETGFVVDARRPEQIQEYIRLLASDRSLREQMAAAAIRSMTMHGYDTFARQVREFYCSALKGRIGQ